MKNKRPIGFKLKSFKSKSMEMKNKTVLIIGGDTHLAIEIAREFSARNNKVVLFGSDEQKLRALKNEIQNCDYVLNDVSSKEDLNKLYAYFAKGFQPIHVLVNNADGLCKNASFIPGAGSTLKSKDVSFLTLADLQEFFIPILAREKEALIVNLFPVTGSYSMFVAPITGLKGPSSLYSKTLKLILSGTRIKMLDIFMHDKRSNLNSAESILKGIHKSRSSLYLK